MKKHSKWLLLLLPFGAIGLLIWWIISRNNSNSAVTTTAQPAVLGSGGGTTIPATISSNPSAGFLGSLGSFFTPSAGGLSGGGGGGSNPLGGIGALLNGVTNLGKAIGNGLSNLFGGFGASSPATSALSSETAGNLANVDNTGPTATALGGEDNLTDTATIQELNNDATFGNSFSNDSIGYGTENSQTNIAGSPSSIFMPDNSSVDQSSFEGGGDSMSFLPTDSGSGSTDLISSDGGGDGGDD